MRYIMHIIRLTKKYSKPRPIVICSVTREKLFGDSLKRRSLAFRESVVRYILLTSALSRLFPNEKGYLMGSSILKSKNICYIYKHNTY